MNKKFIFLIVLLLICSMLIAQKIHVVKKGDTLWDLAGYYYDNPFIWRNIYNANLDKIDDPHWIYPGQEFIIPDVPDDMAEYIPEEEPIDYDTERMPAELIVEKEDDEKEFTY
ncbi:LysM peptidoglycan-binding domain-containing protein, partial [candidate division WOR-3 bacterium]|nr:LysM peptidoglycan-binding domain-containing protein [candidate division WOR-3 bacterium]